MSKKTKNPIMFNTAIILPTNVQQQSFEKVMNVRKMMKLYPSMSLRTACANNGCDYKTYKKYLDFVVKVEGLI